jgi:endoglycosylceramidase
MKKRLLFFYLLFFLTFASFGQSTYPILDNYGRTIILHGLNTSGSAKHIEGHQPWITENDVAREHQDFGFDCVRYLIFWGAIEPEEGKYDEAYLQKVKEHVEWYTQRKMYVILDMHQDVFGYGVGGNGAPVWACTQTKIQNLIPDKWPWWMQNLEPKVKQSYIQFFKYKKRKELQEHYIICWQKVAALFKDNPYVLGYDMMNEPHGGLIIKTLAGGFERRQLKAFYNRLIPRIRNVDTSKYIFFEPRSFGVNFGMKSHLPIVHDSLVRRQKLVYAPHVYPAFVDIGGDFKPKHKKSLAALFKTRIKETTRDKTPMMIGEFGLSPQKKDFDTYLRLFNQLADSCQASWAYWSNDHGGWSPLNADGTPTLILPQLLRVYPQATAGQLIRYAYSPIEKYFEMQFVSDTSIKVPTIIAVPKGIYPNNYKLSVSGTTDYKTEVDPVTNSILLYINKSNIDVRVSIKPGL